MSLSLRPEDKNSPRPIAKPIRTNINQIMLTAIFFYCAPLESFILFDLTFSKAHNQDSI
jgi:hypothetical protein